MVADLTSDKTADRTRGLETLAAAYWKPVYTYLRLRWNRTHEDAADLTQEFFARAVEKELLTRYEPSKAHLRTYLRLCVDGLVANDLKAASREKRGGGAAVLSLDFEDVRRELESAGAQTVASPEDFFEREWARNIFSLSVERFREESAAAGREIRFALFSTYDLEADAGGVEPPPTYESLARHFGTTAIDVTNQLAAARRDFRRIVLGLLKKLTVNDTELRLEARALLGVEVPP
jgi:DNA-directed RNA polymerase specialized sigma24 family protein